MRLCILSRQYTKFSSFNSNYLDFVYFYVGSMPTLPLQSGISVSGWFYYKLLIILFSIINI